MKFLALLTPTEGRDPNEYEPFLIDEEKAVWEAYRAGRLRECYIQRDPLTASFVFEAESFEVVSSELSLFPLVKAGFLDQKIIELGPWTQIQVLFDKRLA